ncbi:MerR family transcriptional regulator [Jiangella alkaliphila]|uniref:DNA-binding transcriptional regulator, MerR family n=1 Tax=Jiangella alkaliphila TaxID=419479 RepID=A0A1H2G856_9ACTN|nr:MerR family transcriptional regulator [Jiangella alkaliphila]SDU15817.1 DNA-binding transcriptional regulator, MerR family [Jiangella alkaliphila]
MRIGELARRTGATERALRYYEEQNLLKPARLPSGYRDYAPSDIEAVRHVRSLLAAGLPSHLIAELLPCMVDTGDGLMPGCRSMLEPLESERDRLTSAIDELTTARTLLAALIDRTPEDDSEYDAWMAAHASA